MIFEWDEIKEQENISKHGVSFDTACKVFLDSRRIILIDDKHSTEEARYFAIGVVDKRILTVRFTIREDSLRIFGAGYWRKGKSYYEKKYNVGR